MVGYQNIEKENIEWSKYRTVSQIKSGQNIEKKKPVLYI